MNANVATIIAAIIGLISTVSTALITRPRTAPATPGAQPARPPQPSQTTWQPPPSARAGNWWQQSGSGSAPGAPQRPWAAPAASYATAAVKISKSLWWGIAGLILWLIPILGYIATLTGLFIAIRDIRSPGLRRYAMAGLIICLIAFACTLVNSAIGAYEGYHGTGWWQH
jgi:hypothetical protein